MKPKYIDLVIAAALSTFLPLVSAGDVSVVLTEQTPFSGSYTGAFGTSHSAGSFVDNLIFNFGVPLAVGGSINLIKGFSFSSLEDGGVVLDSITGTTKSSTLEDGEIRNTFTYRASQAGALPFTFTGNSFTLIASGTAFGPSSSYSGIVNATPAFASPPVSPVPEPETYAMMLAGLGVLGFVARRKAKANQT